MTLPPRPVASTRAAALLERLRTSVVVVLSIVASPASAGFVTIDEFNKADKSDGLGLRSFDGKVDHEGDYISMVSGVPETDKIANVSYSFLPSPLVVKPKFVLTGKNNQTTYLESAILRVSVNGSPYIEKELFAAKTDYEFLVFDFTDRIPISETIEELSISLLRPAGTTGAREFHLTEIEVSDVPEPPTFLLIAACLSGVGIYQLHRAQTHRNAVRRDVRRLFRNQHRDDGYC